jgi:hypothetical protein
MSIWKTKRNLRGAARGAAYCGFVGVVSLVVSSRSAHAELEDRTLVLGREMLLLAKATQHDVTDIDVNGQHVHVGSSVTSDGVGAVLDRYEDHCRKNASQTAESWKELTPANAKDGEAPPFARGSLRSGGAQEGTVVCFTKSSRSVASVVDAIKSFGATGELARIGNARLVYARRSPQTGNTTVLTAWTDERFNLLDLAPEDDATDVRGADFPTIPRLPGSVRVFSATATGTPYGLNVYRSSDAPDAVFSFYDAVMAEGGWSSVEVPPEKSAESPSRLYAKDGVVLTLVTSREEGSTFTGLGLAGVTADPHVR